MRRRIMMKKWRPSAHRVMLVMIDMALLFCVDIFMLGIYPSGDIRLAPKLVILHSLLSAACIFGWRLAGGVYKQIWRYVNTTAYLRLMLLDALAGCTYYLVQKMVFRSLDAITFVRIVSVFALNALASSVIRLVYQSLYEYSGNNQLIKTIRNATKPITGFTEEDSKGKLHHGRKIKIAIVGAGRVGVALAEELTANLMSFYEPVCFIDIDSEKVGRNIKGIPVLKEDDATQITLTQLSVQEIVFALPRLDAERKKQLYEEYKRTGCKIKVYDFPVTQSIENGKRHMREFDIEELLFRDVKEFTDEKTTAYYRGQVVMITGGGGSIGSELARQLVKMKPKQLVIVDVYENCAYDLQQELQIAYGRRVNLAVEIVTITDRGELDKVFAKYHPDIVLHAAAHKHVPLMETNCCEAIKNNVFGTLNVVEMSEKYGVKKFTMISTDKAVNPTNVMGATKRMCEMIVQSHHDGKTNFSCTRFGNVLGSNGSVIPLFKRQIANGGPVTLTDKRIIRYFMTIPEASQLVLQSSAMAKSGELYVLDMGKPVKILELAENMIRLSGFEPYKDINIIETGLRPGEKLYEELLIKTEELDKTDNSMIFIERDKPLSRMEINAKLAVLREAVETDDDENCRQALKKVVPTFHSAKHVNAKAEQAEEMMNARLYDGVAG